MRYFYFIFGDEERERERGREGKEGKKKRKRKGKGKGKEKQAERKETASLKCKKNELGGTFREAPIGGCHSESLLAFARQPFLRLDQMKIRVDLKARVCSCLLREL